MYNVRLNTPALQEGRALVAAILKNRNIRELPAGTTETLSLLIAKAEGSWHSYQTHYNEGCGHTQIFGEASLAVTHVTVALELASQFNGELRLIYHPLPNENPSPTERQFSSEVSRLFKLMASMVKTLQAKTREVIGDTPTSELPLERQDRLGQEFLQRLGFAKHLADLGVSVCKPDHFVYQHPQTSAWLKTRSVIKRNVARALTNAARLDEAASKKAAASGTIQ